MKLIKEILGQLASDTDTSLLLQYYVAEGRGGYFENVRDVASFSSTEIRLLSRGGGVIVKGENLSIRKYVEGDVVIEGDIGGIEKIF